MRFSMPFQGREEARVEVCRLALIEGANRRQLCMQFGISAKTLYKWLRRYEGEGLAGLKERSRRPHSSPGRTDAGLEAAVVAVRRENPAWGGRKIAASLRRQGMAAPAPSTITQILHRHGEAMSSPGQKPWKRFEHAEPNALWQMDFKGEVPFGGGELHPLTVVDDHSRYSVALQAADNQRRQTVQSAVQEAFERYGLPHAILTDNGPPWGDTGERWLTKFGVWLIEHGVTPWHSPPYHPQSHGKNERFNRTLKIELLDRCSFADLGQAQHAFDAWRQRYNHHRPHDALGLTVPAERYRPSPRRFKSAVEPFAYLSDDVLRSVDVNGRFAFASRIFKASKALSGKRIALRHTDRDGLYKVMFRSFVIANIDLNDKPN
jgi:transposase InsO family protein